MFRSFYLSYCGPFGLLKLECRSEPPPSSTAPQLEDPDPTLPFPGLETQRRSMEEFNAIYCIFPLVLSQQADCKPQTRNKKQIRYQCLTSWSGQGRPLQSSKSSNNYHPGFDDYSTIWILIWLYHINRFSPLESATQTTPARPHLLRWHCKLSLCQEAMYLAETGRIFSRKNPARWCKTRN